MACLFLAFGLSADRVAGQTQSQIQYSYDAAGNLVQVTRAAITADLTVTNLAVGTISLNANGSYNIPVTFQVNNIGTGTATATWYDRGYLSTDATLNDTDQVLGGFNTRSINLAAGANYSVSISFTTSTTTAAGAYTLIVKADGGTAASGQFARTGPNFLFEVNEGNNTQGIAINLPANKPDLTVSNASVGAISVSQAGAYSFPVTFTVTNVGGVSALPNFYTLTYLSPDATLDNADQNLGGTSLRDTALAPGASYSATQTYTTTGTTAAGNYTLFVKADGRGTALSQGTNTDSGFLAEASETNNVQALALTLPVKPDLAISNVVVGAIVQNANGSKSIPVTYTVTNAGGVPASPNWFDLAYLSTDTVLDNADQNLGNFYQRITALAAGANYTVTVTFVSTTITSAGSYTLFIKTDGRGTTTGAGTNTDNGSLAEANEANNVIVTSVVLP